MTHSSKCSLFDGHGQHSKIGVNRVIPNDLRHRARNAHTQCPLALVAIYDIYYIIYSSVESEWWMKFLFNEVIKPFNSLNDSMRLVDNDALTPLDITGY